MNRLSVIGSVVLLGVAFSNSHLLLSAQADDSEGSVKVYTVSSDVTAPELIHNDFSSILRTGCREMESGSVRLSLIVDQTGKPRRVFFVHPLGKSLDRVALQVVEADRFTPGKRDGAPVAVAMFIDLTLEGCVVAEKSDSGEEILQEHLRTAPEQTLSRNENVPPNLFLRDTESQPGDNSLHRIGKGVTAPFPIATPEATFPPDKNLRKVGICVLSVIIDANGLTQSPKIFRSLSPAMDQQALAAVERYRFRPAMAAGQPVPVKLTINVNFR